MKTVAAVLSAAIVVSAGAAFACGNSMRFRAREESVVAKASKAYRSGNYAGAAAVAETAMKDADDLSPGDRRALLRTHGLASLKLGNFEKSVTSFMALSDETKEPFVQVKLAEARIRDALRTNQLNVTAKGVLEKLAADGLLADADAWVALANARRLDGDSTGAIAACEDALKVQPGHPEATQVLTTLSLPKTAPSKAPVKPSSKS